MVEPLESSDKPFPTIDQLEQQYQAHLQQQNCLSTPRQFLSDTYDAIHSPSISMYNNTSSNNINQLNTFHTADTETGSLMNGAHSKHYGSTLDSIRTNCSTPSPTTPYWYMTRSNHTNGIDRHRVSYSQNLAHTVLYCIQHKYFNIIVVTAFSILYIMSSSAELVLRKSTVTLIPNYRWMIFILYSLINIVVSLIGCVLHINDILTHIQYNGYPIRSSIYIGVFDCIGTLCLLLSLPALPAITAITCQQLCIPYIHILSIFRTQTPIKLKLLHVFGSCIIIAGCMIPIFIALYNYDINILQPTLIEYTTSIILINLAMLSSAASYTYKQVYLSQYSMNQWLLNFNGSIIQLLTGLSLGPLSLQLQVLGRRLLQQYIIQPQPLPINQPIPQHSKLVPPQSPPSVPLHTDIIQATQPNNTNNTTVTTHVPQPIIEYPDKMKPQHPPQQQLPIVNNLITTAAMTVLYDNNNLQSIVSYTNNIFINFSDGVQCIVYGANNEPNDICTQAKSLIESSIICWLLCICIQHIALKHLYQYNVNSATLLKLSISSIIVSCAVYCIPSLYNILINTNYSNINYNTNLQWIIPSDSIISSIICILLVCIGSYIAQQHDVCDENEIDLWDKLEASFLEDEQQQQLIQRLRNQHN